MKIKYWLSVFIISYFASSCYYYQHIEKPNRKAQAEQSTDGNTVVTSTKKKDKKKKPEYYALEESIDVLKKDAYYKISTEKTITKLRFQKNTVDSIVGHAKGRPDKIIKIAKKEVTDVKERRFSKLRSDIITYGGIGILGAGVFYILTK